MHLALQCSPGHCGRGRFALIELVVVMTVAVVVLLLGGFGPLAGARSTPLRFQLVPVDF